jgi:hypothetical protein
MVELQKWRDQDTALPYINTDDLVDGGNGVEVTIKRIREHSPPLRGTYRINIDGQPVTKDGDHNGDQNIEYDNRHLTMPLRYAYNLRELDLEYAIGSDFDDEIHYFIEYVGRLGPAGVMTFDTSLLTGGASGMSTTITTRRPFSTNPFYSPLPYDFLYTASETPSLNIKVNQIPAYCSNCAYEVNAELNPTVSSASLNGATLTAGVTLPSGSRRRLQGVDISEVSVSLLGVQCLDVTGTIDNF